MALGIDYKLTLYFTKAEVTEEVEFEVYDYNNLIADIGGFLGLLLGVSCVAIYDFLVNFCLTFSHFKERSLRQLARFKPGKG